MRPETWAARNAVVLTCLRCGRDKTRGEWPNYGRYELALHCGNCEGPTATKPREHKLAKKRARRQRYNAQFYSRGLTTKGLARKPVDPIPVGLMARAVRSLAKARRLAAVHDAHVRAYRALSDAERYRWQYRNDPAYALKERIRRQLRKKAEVAPGVAEVIRNALKSRHGKAGGTIEALLGYSMHQLRHHLERQFVEGMSWDGLSRSGWHVDHILPKKCFDLTSIEGVQAYWSLSNLRPLWSRANLAKRDKVLFLC